MTWLIIVITYRKRTDYSIFLKRDQYAPSCGRQILSAAISEATFRIEIDPFAKRLVELRPFSGSRCPRLTA